jgi:hypothetical protein
MTESIKQSIETAKTLANGDPTPHDVSSACGEKTACDAQPAAVKRAYTKPTLRKFSQIDYVTAYGVD